MIKEVIPGCNLLHNHCIQKYSNLPNIWKRMNTNLKNIPVPTNIDTKMELEKGLQQYIQSTLYKFILTELQMQNLNNASHVEHQLQKYTCT